MRMALSGTPGTGKSAVARALRSLGETVIDLNELARRHGFLGGTDRSRRTREVDLGRLGRYLAAEVPAPGRTFLEGHFSHLLDVDRAVVLRCSPAVLRRRLRARGYAAAKVRENSLAEALDAVTQEAVARLGPGKVFEIDTTRRKAAGTALLVRKLARRDFRDAARFGPGRLDWSGDVIRNSIYYTRDDSAKA